VFDPGNRAAEEAAEKAAEPTAPESKLPDWVPGGLAAAALILLLVGVVSALRVRKVIETQRQTVETQRKETDRNQQAILRLLDELSSLADGDLTVQATVTEDITGAIADSINYAVDALRGLVTTINQSAIQLDSATRQTQALSQHLAKASGAQSKQIASATESAGSMASSVEEVSGNAERAADVARHSVEVAHKGGDAVRRTIDGMNTIRETIQDTSKRIKRLGESSQEIGEIVELIGDIGDRTSILALNASIQAAMAGEAGRGFAIVADEVERLADRATEATKRAGILVKTTQTEAAEVMAAMEDTTREVINRSNIANEAGVALSEIQTVSNRLAELIQAISDAAQQQARGSEQVAKSMNEMSSVTRNTAASTKQTAAAINSLALLVDNLNATVSRFKLPAAGSDYTEYAGHGSQPRLVAAR